MLTAPETNITLTDAQTAAIEESKLILLNLEVETTRASRALNVVKNDIIKANEEIEYLTSQKDEISRAKEVAQAELDSLATSVSSSKKKLEALNETISETLSNQHDLTEELESRENAIVSLESKLLKEKEEIESEKQSVASERAEIETAKEAFKTAITAVTWR